MRRESQNKERIFGGLLSMIESDAGNGKNRFYRTPISSGFMKYYNDARDMIIYCSCDEGIFSSFFWLFIFKVRPDFLFLSACTIINKCLWHNDSVMMYGQTQYAHSQFPYLVSLFAQH